MQQKVKYAGTRQSGILLTVSAGLSFPLWRGLETHLVLQQECRIRHFDLVPWPNSFCARGSHPRHKTGGTDLQESFACDEVHSPRRHN